jgi:acetylornithine deacetylase
MNKPIEPSAVTYAPAHSSNSLDSSVPSAATFDWIARLVGVNTVSSESNLGLIEMARDFLYRQGAQCDLTYDRDRRKANLFATLGEGRGPGIVLSGHTDVVPVVGQAWDSDPFIVRHDAGNLYGRGTADMKGFIAASLAQAPYFARQPLPGPIHYALSYDEEVGCFGAMQLVADLQERGIKPACCIVGEPTGMQPIVAHKGVHRFTCCVTGKEAHSAMPNLGVNAIEYAAELVLIIRNIAHELARTEVRDYGFPVPYTTLQTTMLSGGTGQNIIPKQCELFVDVRTLPNQSFETLYAQVQEQAAPIRQRMKLASTEADIVFNYICGVPAFGVGEQEKIVQLAKKLARSNRIERVSFGTEAGLFARAGIPSIIIGPGDIDVAHRPNEFVSLAQLAQCETFLQRLATPSSFALEVAA